MVLQETRPLPGSSAGLLLENLEAYLPYSFFGYFALLAVAKSLRYLFGDKVVVSQNVQFVHNIFLAVQSVGLIYVVGELYFETCALAKLHPVYDIAQAMIASQRVQCEWFAWTKIFFLLNKLYEALDTVILILNNKPTITLHVWHHSTTYIAFGQGLYTGAGFWIGFWNSLIHVIMYLYYAKISMIKPFAKYITSLQIFHLLGGAIYNIVTLYFYPMDVQNCLLYSGIGCFICLSYFLLFLQFYAKKYTPPAKADHGGKESKAKKNA